MVQIIYIYIYIDVSLLLVVVSKRKGRIYNIVYIIRHLFTLTSNNNTCNSNMALSLGLQGMKVTCSGLVAVS